jgi:hypothetical protein
MRAGTILKTELEQSPKKVVGDGGRGGAKMLTDMELNNQLIEEAYTLAKRREYVQRHLGEADLTVLDS